MVRQRDIWFLATFHASRSIAAGMINVALPYLVLQQAQQSPLILGFVYTTGALGTAALDWWGAFWPTWLAGRRCSSW